MEFLKSLFDSGALTWDAFQQAAKSAGFEVVNAAGGAYVPKSDLDTKAQEIINITVNKKRKITTFRYDRYEKTAQNGRFRHFYKTFLVETVGFEPMTS